MTRVEYKYFHMNTTDDAGINKILAQHSKDGRALAGFDVEKSYTGPVTAYFVMKRAMEER